MKKYIIILIVIFLALIVLAAFYPKQKQVCFKEKCFSIEIAKTQEERSSGLMFREKLDFDSGMLFVFPDNGIHGFWMKNTLIPLDIIWINNGKIVYIAKNMQPCKETCDSIIPDKNSRYVLEINSGLSEKLGLKAGDEVSLDY